MEKGKGKSLMREVGSHHREGEGTKERGGGGEKSEKLMSSFLERKKNDKTKLLREERGV